MTKKKVRVFIIVGTRPEAIKLAPVICAMKDMPTKFEVILCSTGQHGKMLDQVCSTFDLTVDCDLKIMTASQSLAEITARSLLGIEKLLKQHSPNVVLVQGDTTSAFAGALAGFYQKIPVGHVEAGLRTHNIYEPFPEEINRKFIDNISAVCFAPTSQAHQYLLDEGIEESNILVTGNTVVDSLQIIVNKQSPSAKTFKQRYGLTANRYVIVTCHRRENIGAPMERVALAIRQLSSRHADLQFVLPVHPNPLVRDVFEKLDSCPNVHCTEPLEYLTFVHVLADAHLVLTDSGGLQEEAPVFQKPVFVLRDVTERPEGIAAGTSQLVGTDTDRIVENVSRVLDDPNAYRRMTGKSDIYGDGQASRKICDAIWERFSFE